MALKTDPKRQPPEQVGNASKSTSKRPCSPNYSHCNIPNSMELYGTLIDSSHAALPQSFSRGADPIITHQHLRSFGSLDPVSFLSLSDEATFPGPAATTQTTNWIWNEHKNSRFAQAFEWICAGLESESHHKLTPSSIMIPQPSDPPTQSCSLWRLILSTMVLNRQLLSLQFTAIIHNDMRFLTCQCYPSHFLEELTPYSPTSALLRFAGFCVFLVAFWRSRLCRSCCYNSNYKLHLKWTQKLKICAGFWVDMRWLRKWHPITNWRPLALWSHSPQILPHSPATSEGLSFPPMSWTGNYFHCNLPQSSTMIWDSWHANATPIIF